MHVYLSGIGGSGLSALAQLAQDCGYKVSGSDREVSANTEMLTKRGVKVYIGQSGKEIKACHQHDPIDSLIISSAIPKNHKEVKFAKTNDINTVKRDYLINKIIKDNQLKLLAVSGTHGKTTTTAMLIWLFNQIGQPVSYSLGTNISFGASGQYLKDSQYFVLEADEFDRHMLKYQPFCSLLPSVDYDHSDTYATVEDYKQAFRNFVANSHCAFTWQEVASYLELKSGHLHLFKPDDSLIEKLKLPGSKTRQNAFLAVQLLCDLFPELPVDKLINAVNKFPGTERRMEKLADNLYSDYAHHPVEIAATIAAAQEINPSVVVVYQPHQNVRQQQIQNLYKDCLKDAKKVYWLPTYLTREDPKLEVLEPERLISQLSSSENVIAADKNQELLNSIKDHQKAGDLVIIMGAGDIDPWARENSL